MERKRSVGVMILAITQIVVGISPVIELLYLKYVKRPIEPNLELMIYPAIMFLPLFLFGIGILNLKKWARLPSIVFAPLLFLVFISSLAPFINYYITNDWKFVLPVLYLIYIYFFTRPKIKEQFK